jgi:hypothetical protein
MKKNMVLPQKIVVANILLLIGGAVIRNSELRFQTPLLGIVFLSWVAIAWLHLASTFKFSEIKS